MSGPFCVQREYWSHSCFCICAFSQGPVAPASGRLRKAPIYTPFQSAWLVLRRIISKCHAKRSQIPQKHIIFLTTKPKLRSHISFFSNLCVNPIGSELKCAVLACVMSPGAIYAWQTVSAALISAKPGSAQLKSLPRQWRSPEIPCAWKMKSYHACMSRIW